MNLSEKLMAEDRWQRFMHEFRIAVNVVAIEADLSVTFLAPVGIGLSRVEFFAAFNEK